MTNVYIKLIVAVIFSLYAGIAICADNAKDHAREFARDVDDFHTALAPLWHATPGKERTRNVCAQAEELENIAGKIHSSDPKELLTSVAELKAECRTAFPDINSVFSQVHHAFHNLVEHPKR